MRPVGMTLVGLALAAVAAAAQPPADPAAEAAKRAEADRRLDAHLVGWQQRMAVLNNFRAEFVVEKTEPVFKRKQEYAGAVLCMKPDLARLRAESKADKTDYEAYICNGKSVYAYSGRDKLITEVPVAVNPADGGGNLMLDFLSGRMTKDDVKKRFQMALFNQDANYIYLDIRPVLGADKREFAQIRFALFGPGVPNKAHVYLPAQMYLVKENGDSEVWTFGRQEVNLPGVGPELFKFENVPGYQFRKAPPPPGQQPPAGGPRVPGQPQPLPGGTGLPAGPGAVKP